MLLYVHEKKNKKVKNSKAHILKLKIILIET